MARWEPHASRRLAEAALELFAENGYDDTTVMDIAARAGLAKSTFFRHFQDKRGVLFGEDVLTGHLDAAIAAAPVDAGALEAVGCGLEALGDLVFTPEYREFAARRRAVIEAHADLREREALKGVSLTAAMACAVAGRGVEVLVAEAAAQLGALALRRAYERWCDVANNDEFGVLVRRCVSEVRGAAAVAAAAP
jgi:AcrR family transcriptional regulator